jgi:general secretion pathway protein B
MSFILNALRKSEQERRNLEAETLNDKILPVQPLQKNNKTTIFITILVIGNVLIIAGIVWFFQNNSISKDEITTLNTPPTFPTQEKMLMPKVISKDSQPLPEKPAPKSDSKITSIAEMIDEQKPDPVVTPLSVKPIITKKPVAETVKAVVSVIKAEQPIKPIPVIKAAEQVESTPAEIVPVKRDIPFLSELPVEFRQSVPKFNINVFVYSQQPEERFVMIDMVKYKPGQQIKDKLLLKEILPVSLVIVYQNQEFQIERP